MISADGTPTTKLSQVSSLPRRDVRLNRKDAHEPHVLCSRPNLVPLASSFSFNQKWKTLVFNSWPSLPLFDFCPVRSTNWVQRWTVLSCAINQVNMWRLFWKDTRRLSELLQSNNTYIFFSPHRHWPPSWRATLIRTFTAFVLLLINQKCCLLYWH